MKSRGTALKMERCSDQSVCLCMMCMTVLCTFLSRHLVCPSPWWKLNVRAGVFDTCTFMIHIQFYWLKPLCWQRKAELSIYTTTKFFSTIILCLQYLTKKLLLLYWILNICIGRHTKKKKNPFCLVIFNSPEVKTWNKQKTLPVNMVSWDAMFTASGDCRHKLLQYRLYWSIQAAVAARCWQTAELGRVASFSLTLLCSNGRNIPLAFLVNF